jgi:hypothetical protein
MEKHPDLAKKFSRRALKPVSLEGHKDTVDRLLQDGYFNDRWKEDALRVFANLPTDSETRPTRSAAMYRYRNLRKKAMQPMANAEMKNAVILYELMRKEGMSEEVAIREVELLTRRTQNPSTALEESGLYEDIKSKALGLFMPFLGQPTVAHNFLATSLTKLKHAQKTGEGLEQARRLAIGAAAGLAANAVMVAAVRYTVRSLSDGRFPWEPPEDEDDKAREQYYVLTGLLQEALDTTAPGSGKVITSLVDAVKQNGKVRPENLGFRMWSDFWRGIFAVQDGLTRTEAEEKYGRGRSDRDRLIDGLEDLASSSAQLFGLPVGGADQVWNMLRGFLVPEKEDNKK